MESEADYRRRGQAHAPKTQDEMRRAARNLAADGHGDHDVAAILGIDVAAARALIGERK